MNRRVELTATPGGISPVGGAQFNMIGLTALLRNECQYLRNGFVRTDAGKDQDTTDKGKTPQNACHETTLDL